MLSLSHLELGITFKKINCWLLLQYSKCVFIDSDCLVLHEIDDLFDSIVVKWHSSENNDRRYIRWDCFFSWEYLRQRSFFNQFERFLTIFSLKRNRCVNHYLVESDCPFFFFERKYSSFDFCIAKRSSKELPFRKSSYCHHLYNRFVLFVVLPSSLLDDQNIRTSFMGSLLKTICHGEQGKAQQYRLSHPQDQIQPFSFSFNTNGFCFV